MNKSKENSAEKDFISELLNEIANSDLPEEEKIFFQATLSGELPKEIADSNMSEGDKENSAKEDFSELSNEIDNRDLSEEIKKLTKEELSVLLDEIDNSDLSEKEKNYSRCFVW